MFTVFQDNDLLEDFDTVEEAASFLRSIAEAMQGDATRIERMANAMEREQTFQSTPMVGPPVWTFDGSYLALSVEKS